MGGRKRWQISSDDAGNFVEDAPIRVLRDFESQQEWVLEHGDMLYLPPKYAHYGVALDEGMTYSIGFRAPTSQEIVGKFLEHLQDELKLEGMYSDPERLPAEHPGEIDQMFVDKISALIDQLRWNEAISASLLAAISANPKPMCSMKRRKTRLITMNLPTPSRRAAWCSTLNRSCCTKARIYISMAKR